MEFFESANIELDADDLQRIGIGQLSRYCASIHSAEEQQPTLGRISGIWGDVRIERALIHGGLRFSLPDCPCNLAWTLTRSAPGEAEAVVIHLTTSRQHHELDVIDAIHTFIEDWKHGLEQAGFASSDV